MADEDLTALEARACVACRHFRGRDLMCMHPSVTRVGKVDGRVHSRECAYDLRDRWWTLLEMLRGRPSRCDAAGAFFEPAAQADELRLGRV